MSAPVDSQQASRQQPKTKSGWVRVQCLQCNEAAVVRLQRRESLESLREILTCRRCNASGPRIEPCDAPPFGLFSGRMTPALFGAGIVLAIAIAYTAVLFANAIDHQVAQNTRLSPKGGYYDRIDRRSLPDTPR